GQESAEVNKSRAMAQKIWVLAHEADQLAQDYQNQSPHNAQQSSNEGFSPGPVSLPLVQAGLTPWWWYPMTGCRDPGACTTHIRDRGVILHAERESGRHREIG